MRINANYFAILFALWQGAGSASEEPPNTVNALSTYEAEPNMTRPDSAHAGFWALFTMACSAPSDPNHEDTTQACEVLWSKEVILITSTSGYDGEPRYRPPSGERSRVDYVGENLVIRRSLGKTVLFTRSRNEIREDFAGYVIQPNGQTVRSKFMTVLMKYRIGTRDSVYMFDQFRLAMANGVAQYFSQTPSESKGRFSPSDAAISIPGKFSGSEGRWTVTYNEPEPLIRHATFTRERDGVVSVTVSNSGVHKCLDLALAKSGTLTISSYTARFELLTITNLDTGGEGFRRRLDEATKRIEAPLPKRSEILDFRGPVAKAYSPQ